MITGSILQQQFMGTGVGAVNTTTRFVSLIDVPLRPRVDFTIFSSREQGYVNEIMVRSQSMDFGITLYIDDAISMYATYSDLVHIGQNSPDISAFDELDIDGNRTGYYVLSVRNIPYYYSFEAQLMNIGSSNILLSNVFAKYIIVVT